MKTIPPPCPEPETGPKYWRSLDQLADTPEFRQMVEREFPAGASELTDPQTRRYFMKIMSASFALAGIGLTGCRKPEEYIYPFSKMPEGYIHGVAKYYASAMPTQTGAIPLLVKSNDGRPTKIEGNPSHPDSNGGTNTFAQAAILNLYDADRATRFTNGGNGASKEAAFDFLGQTAAKFQANGGEGLRFLAERSSSPSRLRLQALIAEKYPKSAWHSYEAVDYGIYREAAQIAFGRSVSPYPRLSEAKAVLALDSDFLALEEDTHRHTRGFASRRKLKNPEDAAARMNRLYVVESLMTVTGMNADHRLRVAPSVVSKVALLIAGEVISLSGDASLSTLAGTFKQAGAGATVDAKWVTECAKDLIANKGQSLILAGSRQPMLVQVAALAANAALGNIGKTLVLNPASSLKEGTIAELAAALNAGQVDTLVILGGNPVYNAPAELAWATAQAKAKSVIRHGFYVDETSAASQWVFPATHFLESWGDARTSDGTLVPVQPLIEPLFTGVTDIELLARVAGAPRTASYEIVRETFAGIIGGVNVEDRWRKFLHDGYVAGTAWAPENVSINAAAVAQVASSNPLPAPAGGIEAVFHADYSVDDGFYSNNGWLQELPDPVTKVVWENVLLISSATAKSLGIDPRDLEDNNTQVPIVKVEVGGQTIEGPAWTQPGMADNTVALALGYGRPKAGRIGTGVGYNAYKLRQSKGLHSASAKLTVTDRKHPLSTTQNHWSMEGRPVIREANLEQYKSKPDFVIGMNFPEPPVNRPLYPNPLDEAKKKAHHQWGMVIDLNACVGCTACVVACQSENNVPIVGKNQVRRSREMHWLRIDRYYTGSIEDPQVVNQPMMCQHCESAPCESVCPVNATVHDHEGLNVMAYNRCVGTRYCSNNCPYKVRRFNYFDYNKRPIDKLYYGPLASRPKDEMDLVKLAKNPDVTVRMRGVMEKCTFCIQRIEGAKIARKVKAGATAEVEVPDGTFTTACAQACPAGAITFGNVANPDSQVSQQKKLDRNYTVLDFLSTKPRLTYLARVRNPNPAMPDYQANPHSITEYSDKMGSSPFATHGEGHEAHAATEAHAEQKGAH